MTYDGVSLGDLEIGSRIHAITHWVKTLGH